MHRNTLLQYNIENNENLKKEYSANDLELVKERLSYGKAKIW